MRSNQVASNRIAAAFPMAAAYTLVAAQALQTVLLGGGLLVRDAQIVVRVCREWRRSIFAGLMGATASACWFTAMAMKPPNGEPKISLVGRCEDEVVRVNGKWLIKSRNLFP